MDKSLYKISNINKMDPFLMNITSGSDHWMYLSSTGCLTAGRNKAKYCLFPYVTDDLLHHNSHFTGPFTIIKVENGKEAQFWRPLMQTYHSENFERHLYKNSIGDWVIFEEKNLELNLSFFYEWRASEKYGFVKKSWIKNHQDKTVRVEIIDGLRNIMPPGVDLRTNQSMSNLSNAYKITEYVKDADCALFYMNSLMMDRPEPGESLFANIVWSYYNGDKSISVEENIIKNFLENDDFKESSLKRGNPGSFIMNINTNLQPYESRQWYIVADVNKSHVDLQKFLKKKNKHKSLIEKIEDDVNNTHLILESAIGAADGFQISRKNINDMHHTSNVLFNILRGGVFISNYDIDLNDFHLFIKSRNKLVYHENIKEIQKLKSPLTLFDLQNLSNTVTDPSLKRLCLEYLPLILARRHGDPSRPWNHFEIKMKKEDGSQRFFYEGNWRDIFQNWEALGQSYPLFWESISSKFLNAITVDGFNPYRLNSEGIDWEIIDPEDAWSFIGYWNDHQVIYLLKILENFQRHYPSKIEALLRESVFSYANVPYQIKTFDQIISNPKATIQFDFNKNENINELVNKIGGDGKLVLDKNNRVYHACLLEKFLIITLAKICNLIPNAGIWLNTQRPEWNDANNALVGYGTSMVTVFYLHRFLIFFKKIISNTKYNSVNISTEIFKFFDDVYCLLKNRYPDDNKTFLKMGQKFSNYRQIIYKKSFSDKKSIKLKEILDFIDLSIELLDKSISSNKKDNGLFHGYNTVHFKQKIKNLNIQHLPLMLEGQVAALSSNKLNIKETIKLLENLYTSDLFRKDMKSFILYPEKKIIAFLEKNIIPSSLINESSLIKLMVNQKNYSIVNIDSENNLRFNPSLINIFYLEKTLSSLKKSNKYSVLVDIDREIVLKAYENVFKHRDYTGRAETMFSYEGMGSIYWHMISKLLLSVQESFLRYKDVQLPSARSRELKKLGQLYYNIRSGLSSSKTPQEYGAFPYDPYSHTPSHSGAQQPGMTGQVKEEILTRFGELGCRVIDEQLFFDPCLLREDEFLSRSTLFEFYDIYQVRRKIEIKKNQIGFTYCQVPIIYILFDQLQARILIMFDDNSEIELIGNKLTKNQSRNIFNRNGKIIQINVFFNKEILFN
tara:strand:+ start:74209 stop:77589 length:3381 start_codon:yes stop_codon:yes gene_type:complete